MMSLTRQQSKALDLIREANRHGTAPSYEELAAHLGISAKSNVHRIICCLEQRGAIRRMPRQARALVAIDNLKSLTTEELHNLLRRVSNELMERAQ